MGLLFLFFPLGFFCLFSHSIPTRNGAIWWVYYCGIVLCFGLGLYHHGSNSKPTHTDDDSVGQSNGSGSDSLYLLLLRDFQILFYKANGKVFFFFLICGLDMLWIWFFWLDCFSFWYLGKFHFYQGLQIRMVQFWIFEYIHTAVNKGHWMIMVFILFFNNL